MRHYLVVANQTLKQPELTEKLRACIDAGPCDFFILVPATRAHEPLRWTPADAHAVARRRLDSALERFRSFGADVVGEVGVASPLAAIGDLLRRRTFDVLILSTLPLGPSRWLRHDLPDQIEQLFNLPVELVTPPLDLVAAEAASETVDVTTVPGQGAVSTP
jgi:GABA permease